MRAIGSGLQNVLFADVRTAEDARVCVRSVRAEHQSEVGRIMLEQQDREQDRDRDIGPGIE